MDLLEQDLTRFKKPGLAAVGGIAAALVIATVPAVFLEKIIGITGLSEIVSAAAPPLGNTAKALIAIVAGAVSASIIYIFLNREEGSGMGLALPKFSVSDDDNVEDAGKSKFALPKFSLKKLLQKPMKKSSAKDSKIMDLADLPKLREADAHPDAPARRPIFAETDLGSPLASKIKPFEESKTAQEVAAAPNATAPQPAPAPFIAEKSLSVQAEDVAAIAPAAQPVVQEPSPQVVAAPAEQIEVDEHKEDMSNLSIAQLAERLESGLTHLKNLEAAKQAPVAMQPIAPPAPVAEDVAMASDQEAPLEVPPLKTVEKTEEDALVARQADMDAALKAALGTLEKMTAHR